MSIVRLTDAANIVTDIYALGICASVGGFGHNSSSASSTGAIPSATAMGNGSMGGTVPFTGQAGSVGGNIGWTVTVGILGLLSVLIWGM